MRTRTGVWRDILIYTAVWTLLALFSFAEWLANAPLRTGPQPWPPALARTLVDYYTIGLTTTPVYVWLVRRVPIVSPHVAGKVLLYLVVLAVCVVLKWVVHVPLANALFHKNWSIWFMLVNDSFGVVLAQLIFVATLIAIEWYRAARRSEVRASELAAQLSSAQLDVLRSQLDPHFLFNTLNSVSALMHRDVDAADTMLARLSEMLRLTLGSSAQEVPLRTELETVRLYLSIMDARFGDRLSASFDVDDALLDERVPSFVLQPLVENVVRHGIDETTRRTTIRISAAADDALITLRIADDGRGLPPDAGRREGLGLRNTRLRLAELYGGAARLEVANRDGGGTQVIVAVPRRVGLVAAG